MASAAEPICRKKTWSTPLQYLTLIGKLSDRLTVFFKTLAPVMSPHAPQTVFSPAPTMFPVGPAQNILCGDSFLFLKPIRKITKSRRTRSVFRLS